MAGRLARRLLTGTVLTVAALVALAASPAPAQAEGHDYITISGDDLTEPVSLDADDQPRSYALLLDQVAWLVDRAGDAPEPDPDTLGPAFALRVHREGTPRYDFLLYPLADGGPRVFRPADQPGDREVDPAWFFGRLSMTEALTTVGVPVTGDPAGTGGVGGGVPEPEPTTAAPVEPLGLAEQWRRSLLLTLGLAGAMLAGIASVAFLLRRDPRPRA